MVAVVHSVTPSTWPSSDSNPECYSSVVFGFGNTTKKVMQSHYTSWRHGGRRHSSYSFFTSALDAGEWSVSRPGRVLFLGTPGTDGTGGCVVLTAGLDTEARGKILCLCRDRTSLARSPSLWSDTILPELPVLKGNTALSLKVSCL
jgi:hypothetical protein